MMWRGFVRSIAWFILQRMIFLLASLYGKVYFSKLVFDMSFSAYRLGHLAAWFPCQLRIGKVHYKSSKGFKMRTSLERMVYFSLSPGIILYHSDMCEIQEVNSPPFCVLVLCGIPGSGKSSLAKVLVAQSGRITDPKLAEKSLYFIHIEYDYLLPREVERHILEVEQDDNKVSPWKRYRNDILECVDVIVHFTKANRTKHSDPINLANLLDQCCKPEHVRQELWDRFVTMTSQHTGTATEEDIICFVIDDNMYYRSMRHKYYQLARKYNTGFCQVCLIIPEDLAISRNCKRQERVDPEIICSMNSRFELPDSTVYSWEKYSVTIEAQASDCVFEATDLVRRASENPVEIFLEPDFELRNQSREICSESVLHQADQIMRRIISKEMNSAKESGLTATEMKDLAAGLQRKRKKLLSNLKEGLELVPRDLNVGKNDSKDEESHLYDFIQGLFSGRDVT